MNEELEEHVIRLKLIYLNGYLEALATLNSYSVVGMRYKLFLYNFSAGDIVEAIQHHSFELYGTYPNNYNFELQPVKKWKELLNNEFSAIFKRRIPGGKNVNNSEYIENELVNEYKRSYNSCFHSFITSFEESIFTPETEVHKLIIDTKGAFNRLVGIDLIFEISSTQIVVLQMIGSD